MTTNHTPGPWNVGTIDKVINRLSVFARIGKTQLARIASTDGHEVGFGISQVEMEANARLIAAAPEMADYISYVEDKISMDEMPLTYNQWQQAGFDIASDKLHRSIMSPDKLTDEEIKEMLEKFKDLGEKASYHYADDSGKEWDLGNKAKRQCLEIFDANPDLHDKMRDIAKGFLWSLKYEREPLCTA